MLREVGGPENLVFEPWPVSAPAAGEILVRHEAIGVNFHDTYVRSGQYRTLPLPGVPGIEGAGVVEAIGSGVSEFSPGDRISYIDSAYGAYSQARTLAVRLALRLPAEISMNTAASCTVRALTVCLLLYHVRPVLAGETILVHAGAGGIGRLLIQLAKHLGAIVITTVGSAAKAEIAKACGADYLILYRREDFVDRVREITQGAGVAAVYDSVGAVTFDGSLECLDYLGALVNFGQSSGPVPPFAVSRLATRSNTLVRPILFHYIRKRAQLEKLAEQAFILITKSVLRPPLAEPFPLSQASEAHRALESRETLGAIVLAP